MDKTAITDLQKQLLKKTESEEALKKRVSIWKSSSLSYRKKLNSLVYQYESVVVEQKKIIDNLINNAPKLFYLYLVKRYKEWKERRVRKNE